MIKSSKKFKYITRQCSTCGKKTKILLYANGKHEGAYYFGKIPLCTDKVWEEARKSGTHKSKIGKMTIDVMNKDPKPYKYVEYWECQKCYDKITK